MTKIANYATYFFILTTLALTVVSIGGIWGALNEDVVWKSFESIGLIAIASVVVLVVEAFSDKKAVSQEEASEYMEALHVFSFLHRISVTLIIVSLVVCVSLGLLSIWEIMDTDGLYKAVSSIATIGFYALITLGVCISRERKISSTEIVGMNAGAAPAAQPATEVPPVASAPQA